MKYLFQNNDSKIYEVSQILMAKYINVTINKKKNVVRNI